MRPADTPRAGSPASTSSPQPNPQIDGAVPLAVMPHDRTPEIPQAPATLCNCGHVLDAHEHYRAGTDCAICGRSGCRTFRPVTR